MKTMIHARRLAERTPADRNRYVDFLRAVSIMAVVVGHWLIAAPVVIDGEIRGINMLAEAPWTQWLTWVFQVMPIFFVVGGYSNAASWRAAAERGADYGEWLGSRLRRLVLPAAPLIALWTGIAAAGRAFGMDRDVLRLGSQAALIPLWFLAVYVIVVALTPVTLHLWDRFGVRSFAGMTALAVVVDAVRWQSTELIGWTNFVFVWAAVHQLGYAWRDGRFTVGRSLAVGLGGLTLLVALTTVGPYPVSMVGVPGAAATNNSPPTVALIALGVTQAGLLIALESRAQRWLAKVRPWAATIVINGSIMTLYLWHLTAMVLLIGASLLAGGAGMGLAPASGAWWLTRPVWLAVLSIATAPFLLGFGRFERPSPTAMTSPGVALMIAVLACLGFSSVAGGGIGNAEQWLRPIAVVPTLVAAGWLWFMGRAGAGVGR
jgi:fucose 4-O-acetylase-like acetyltransferase